jgi:N-acetylneuraminic acid mutarotase
MAGPGDIPSWLAQVHASAAPSAVLAGNGSDNQLPGWTQLQGDGSPAGRYGHTVTAIPGLRWLVIGGLTSTEKGATPAREVHLLRTDTLVWERAPDVPARTGITHHSATFIPDTGNTQSGQVLIIGGRGEEGQRSMLSCTTMHTQEPCSWSRKEAIKEAGYPAPRQSHSAVLVDGNRVFLCGGHDKSGAALDDVWIFHQDTLLWVKTAASGAPFVGRAGHTATIVGRQMLVFAGSTGAQQQQDLRDLWAFDVDTHVWSQVRQNTATRIAGRGTGVQTN